MAKAGRPNILILWGETVGQTPASHRSAARRIPTGKAAGVCRYSYAGPVK
jgi:hypothetical protein